MNTITFWKSWSLKNQIIFWFLALLMLSSIGSFWYFYLIYPEPAISWDQFQQLAIEEFSLRSYTRGSFTVPVLADNFLITEVLAGSGLNPSIFYYYFFLLATSIAAVVLVTIISTLSRYWFIIGMALFCVFIVSLQLDSTMVFNQPGRILTIIYVMLFCGLGYLFHVIKTETPFLSRLLSFSTLYILMLITVYLFGKVESPLLYIAVHGFLMSTILTIIFILMIAHEIPAAFINIITQGTRQSKSFQHFIVIFGFYFINLLLAYGIKIGYFNLSIWVVDFFLLFTISAVLSVWGFRQREAQYENFFKADPIGTYLILSLALLAFTTIGYFISNTNDTVIQVMKDFIIYSHLGYGIIFLFYVISNFGSMLSKNLQVHKVLYKPNTMPYFTFGFMGLICTFGFLIFDTNWRTPFNQAFAAYYNSYGDLYLTQGNLEEAEKNYGKSIIIRNQNHHAHYVMATIKEEQLEPRDEIKELQEAKESFPFAQTIVNLAEAYQRNDKPSEALNVIDKASIKNKGVLHNAKGLLFMQVNLSDSALFYFQQARKENKVKEIAEANLLAAGVKFSLTYPADSLLILLGSENDAAKSNALALANKQKTSITSDFTLDRDTTLSATKAAFLCNYLLNNREQIDTSLINKAIALAKLPVNESFKGYIISSAAQALYTQGSVKRAFELVRDQAYQDGKAKYFHLLGTWSLEQGNPNIAADYFVISKDKLHPLGLMNEAIALTEARNYSEAKIRWDSLSKSDSALQLSINKVTLVLNASQNQVSQLDDEGKYLFCRYKLNLEDEDTFQKIITSMVNIEWKAKTIIEYSNRWFEADELSKSAAFLALADGLVVKNENTLAFYHYLKIMLLAESKRFNELQQELKQQEHIKKVFKNEFIYWKALLDEKAGNKNTAFNAYLYLADANPYFEEGVVSSARFFTSNGDDKLKPYNILVSGLQANPTSVKLIKAYILQSAAFDFQDEVTTYKERLKGLISAEAYARFLKENGL